MNNRQFVCLFLLLLFTACVPNDEVEQQATVLPIISETYTPTPTRTITPKPSLTATETYEPSPTAITTRVPKEQAIVVDEFKGFAISLVWDVDQRYLYIGTKENGLVAYDTQENQLGSYVGNGAQIQALAVSPNGEILAAALGNDGSIRFLSTETGMVESMIWPAHEDWPQALAFGVESDWLASCGDDQKLLLWDVNRGEIIQSLHEDSTCLGLEVSSDGRTMVAGFGYEEVIRVWDTRTWTLRSTFDGDQAQDLAISPDGKRVVTAGGGIHEANVWDVDSGSLIFNLREHPSWVWAVAYSPKGNLIASAGLGVAVFVWDADTGEHIRELYGGPDFIQALVFSPDGDWLASGGEEVILWDVSDF